MTVPSAVRRIEYAGNGATTAFATFRFLANAHVVAQVVNDATGAVTDWALTTNYTLAGAGAASGTLTAVVAPATGYTLVISRDVPLTQEADYVANDNFPAESHESALDKLTMVDQQQQEEIDRSLRLPVSYTGAFDVMLPSPVASMYPRVNSAGTAIEWTAGVYNTGTWLSSATGAVARSIDATLDDNIHIDNFGAAGDGAWVGDSSTGWWVGTDDTTAFNAALTHALSVGGELQFGNGKVYMINYAAVTVSGEGKGPIRFVGKGAPNPLSQLAKGSLIAQIAGNTATLLTMTGDWNSSGGNYPIGGVTFENVGLATCRACTGWAFDGFNITNPHNGIVNPSIRVTNPAAAGGMRLRSCWKVIVTNPDFRGPGSGASRGLVILGEETATVSDGTSNMIVVENPNIEYFGVNAQLGKHTESGGGFMHSIKVIGGQVGHAVTYGLVCGRVMDLDIDGLHTELNGYSGILTDDDAGGTDPLRVRIRCDSFNDGMDATADTADSYAVQVNRGRNIRIGMRSQEARAGIYVADSVDAGDIIIDDDTHFGGKADGTTSRTALYIANAAPSTSKRVTMGYHTFGYTWGNGGQDIIHNPATITHRKVIENTLTITDTDDTIAVCYPWSSGFRLAASGAKTLEDITAPTNYSLATGMVLNLYSNNSNTTIKDISSGSGANFKLRDGVDLLMDQYCMLQVEYRDTMWVEVGRSYNKSGTQAHGNNATMAVSVWTKLIRSTTSVATDVTGFAITGTLPDGFKVPVHFTTANCTLKDVSTTGTWNLSGSADYVNPPAGTIMEFTYSNGSWYESGRVNT